MLKDIIKLSRLTSLNLAMNNLTTIPETATLPSTLTYLNISTNNLSAIPPKFLNNLPSLKTLNLSYNSILEFPLEISYFIYCPPFFPITNIVI